MSRYPQPGTSSVMYWEDRPSEPVIVLATSRHKKMLTVEQALPLLVEEWDEYERTANSLTAEKIRWRSVTRADLENCYLGDFDEGGWHTEGTGAAWVDVLRCDPVHEPVLKERV